MAHNDSSTYSSDTESESDERYSSTDLSDNDSDFGTVNLQNTQTESGYGCSSVRSQTEAQSSNFTSLNSNQESSTGASQNKRKRKNNENSKKNKKDYLETIKKTFVKERESKICKFVLPNQKVCNRQYSLNSSNSSLKYHLVNEHGFVFKECESNKKVKPDIDEKLVEWIIDDLQPLSVVEGQKFIDLVNILDSSYQVPCLSKIEYLIDNFYEKSLKDKKDILQKIKSNLIIN